MMIGTNSIKIGDKNYKVKEARSNKELELGLKGVKDLPQDEGMLFYINEDLNKVTFTMEDMNIPLDIIFINLDLEVIDVRRDCLPNLKDITVTSEDIISYVLEVNVNSDIKVGDLLEFDEDVPVMKVLAPDGSTLMLLWGGERIVSRRETKILIKKAKKALFTNKDSDLKALGRYIFKVFKGQDTRNPEYVASPD